MSETTSQRVDMAKIIGRENLSQLARRSNWIGLALVMHAWFVIFASMALFYFFPNPVTFILAIMLIGTRQLGLAILMHDASHNALMKSQKWNDPIGNWFCACPVWAHIGAYRHYHLQHHAHTQQANDPDLILSQPFPISRASLRRKMIRDLTGQTAYSQRMSQLKTALGSPDQPVHLRAQTFIKRMGAIFTSQFILLIICTAVFHWSYFFIFWLLPFFTYYMAITRLRNIAEHAVVPDDNDAFRNARTTQAGWLARSFLAPYWVNYHVEHHLMMYVPCYRLPKLHQMLKQHDLLWKMETATSYVDILKRATSRPESGNSPPASRGPRLSGSFTEGFETK